MDLKFSHVDILVEDLDEACAYYANILNARLSTTQVWERGGLHVRYAVALMGQERFMLVQPLAGNLRVLLDTHGEGMIYRHCYTTPDIEVAYAELVAKGVQMFRELKTAKAATVDAVAFGNDAAKAVTPEELKGVVDTHERRQITNGTKAVIQKAGASIKRPAA